jgi:5-methylcytosine-specific restriction enzyme subunit McrC
MPALKSVTMSEWDEIVVPNMSLPLKERTHLRSWRSSGRLQIDELKDSLRIRSTSWVGVLALPSLEVRVTPKLPGSSRDLVRLIEAAGSLSGLTESLGRWKFDITGINLFDLIALLFTLAAEKVLRGGLLTDYIEHEDLLPGVRGRILVDRQVLHRFGQVDRIWCRFDEPEENTPENQLITLALRVARRRIRDHEVRSRMHRLQAVFESLSDPSEIDPRTLRSQLVYHRLNEHYREAHQLAWLILDATGPRDLLAPGSAEMFAFFLNMNPLFENFVRTFIKHAVKHEGYRVLPSVGVRSIIRHLPEGYSYGTIRPDVLVERQGFRFPVDAKYKRYEDFKVGSSDIYQCFLYAFAFTNPSYALGRGAALMYPTSADIKLERLEVRSSDGQKGAEIAVFGLPIRAALDQLESGIAGDVTKRVRNLVSRYCRAETPVASASMNTYDSTPATSLRSS